MSIISNSVYSPEIINVGGEFMTVFLIIAFAISYLSIDTKYWNKLVSDTFDLCSNPLLLIFIVIVTFKVMIII